MAGLTVSDLIFCDSAFLFNVQPAHEEVPLALVASWSGDANLSCWWRREALHASDSHLIFTDLLHLNTLKICGHIAIVVQWSLNLIE